MRQSTIDKDSNLNLAETPINVSLPLNTTPGVSTRIPLRSLHGQQAMTIVELLISVLILLPLFTVGMQAFIKCMDLSDMAQNSSLALGGIKNRITAIENTAFNQVFNTYNTTTFTINGVTGMGKTYIDNSNPNHVTVSISFSWRQRSGLVIGEDTDLDGVLDAGEDTNGNGQLDSIVTITTQIYDMS